MINNLSHCICSLISSSGNAYIFISILLHKQLATKLSKPKVFRQQTEVPSSDAPVLCLSRTGATSRLYFGSRAMEGHLSSKSNEWEYIKKSCKYNWRFYASDDNTEEALLLIGMWNIHTRCRWFSQQKKKTADCEIIR